MAAAYQESSVPPLALRLSIPATKAFRDLGTSMAVKFAKTVGCTEDEIAHIEASFVRATDGVLGAVFEDSGVSLDIELAREEAGGPEIRVRHAGGEPEVIRLLQHP
jgi:hypothetical protein